LSKVYAVFLMKNDGMNWYLKIAAGSMPENLKILFELEYQRRMFDLHLFRGSEQEKQFYIQELEDPLREIIQRIARSIAQSMAMYLDAFIEGLLQAFEDEKGMILGYDDYEGVMPPTLNEDLDPTDPENIQYIAEHEPGLAFIKPISNAIIDLQQIDRKSITEAIRGLHKALAVAHGGGPFTDHLESLEQLNKGDIKQVLDYHHNRTDFSNLNRSLRKKGLMIPV
jgi:hypothetical protein